MKQERTLTKFICDECEKQTEEAEQPITIPYGDGWVYLYHFTYKETKSNEKCFKDKHFCSKECLIKYLMRKLE